MASAVDIGMKRDDEFDIDTDDAAHAATRPGATPSGLGASHDESAAAPGSRAPASAAVEASSSDEAVIEVADDEIETAEPGLSHQTLPSPVASGVRTRPPAPPSVRPRAPTSSQRAWLPPPRHLSSAPPASSAWPSGPSASSRPAGADPWVLANRTLELSRANARVAELVEQVAYRDARIAELEENLMQLRRKLAALEQPPAAPASRSEPGASAAASSEQEAPVVTQTRPVIGAELGPTPQQGAASDDEHVDDDDAPSDELERESDFGARTAAAGSEEDLQQISGIGPRFEAALREHGITRLSQIAAWSEADVRQVAKVLRIPKSRIVKGRWIEVAREVIGTRAASE